MVSPTLTRWPLQRDHPRRQSPRLTPQAGTSPTEFQRDLSISYNNLADLARAAGQVEQASTLYQQSLTICERVLGVNHPETAALKEMLLGLEEAP